MDHLLLSNPHKVITESSYHTPKRNGHQFIRTPTPGVGRFSQNTTTFIFLREEYHQWILENFGDYTIRQKLEEGRRVINLYGDPAMLVLFKLTWL